LSSSANLARHSDHLLHEHAAWGDFQAARQDINLRIIEILDKRGIEPALPAWKVFLAQAEPVAEPARPLPPPQPEPALSTATDSPVPDDALNATSSGQAFLPSVIFEIAP
jgi:hypothetical protein